MLQARLSAVARSQPGHLFELKLRIRCSYGNDLIEIYEKLGVLKNYLLTLQVQLN